MEQKLRNYELVFIVQPDLEDEGVNAVVDQITQVITSNGGIVTQVGQLADNSGQIASTETWKKRKLAYPIKKRREGYYPVVRLQAEPRVLPELDRALKLHEDILRHLIVRMED